MHCFFTIFTSAYSITDKILQQLNISINLWEWLLVGVRMHH